MGADSEDTARARGFTIVELLVALALIILIMAILSEAFVAALESVRYLKAVGDVQERLRVGATPLRRDLLARHFVEDEKVSTLRPDPSPNPWPDNITGGFVRIEQGAMLDASDTEALRTFDAVRKKDGLGAAIRWRESQFEG